MPTPIAKWKLCGNPVINEVFDYMEKDPDWIQISEVVEVEFVDLPREITVPLEIDAIDRKIKEAREKFADAIGGLELRRAKLLAISSDG